MSGPGCVVRGYIVPGMPHPLLAPDASPAWRSLRDSYERVRALQRAHPEHRGRWVVLDDDGNVLDEFH